MTVSMHHPGMPELQQSPVSKMEPVIEKNIVTIQPEGIAL